MVLHDIALHLMILHSLACHCIVSYGVAWYCIVGFGARAVSRKTPTYFICINQPILQKWSEQWIGQPLKLNWEIPYGENLLLWWKQDLISSSVIANQINQFFEEMTTFCCSTWCGRGTARRWTGRGTRRWTGPATSPRTAKLLHTNPSPGRNREVLGEFLKARLVQIQIHMLVLVALREHFRLETQKFEDSEDSYWPSDRMQQKCGVK